MRLDPVVFGIIRILAYDKRVYTYNKVVMNSNNRQSLHYLWSFGLLCLLFVLLAIGINMNDVLLPQFKRAFQLDNFQSALIQSSFYLAYFLIPIPASLMMKRFGYKNSILFGLMCYALGALAFFLLSMICFECIGLFSIRDSQLIHYAFFLFFLFIMASGMAIVDTAINPFIVAMGPEKSSYYRLNLAQCFFGVGAVGVVFLAKQFILARTPDKSPQQLSQLSAQVLENYHANLVYVMKMPYLVLAALIVLVLVLILKTRYTMIRDEQIEKKDHLGHVFSESFGRIIHYTHWRWAVVAQFFSNGAQTAVLAFLIHYAMLAMPGISSAQAADYLLASAICYLLGKVFGTYLLKKFPAHLVLGAFALLGALTCLCAAFLPAYIGVYPLLFTVFFTSIQFATIISLGLRGLGQDVKPASSFLMMAIAGPAIITPMMGWVADRVGSLPIAEIIPALCLLVVAYYAYRKAMCPIAQD